MNRRSWLVAIVITGPVCGLGKPQEQASGVETSIGELDGRIVAVTLMSDSEDLVLLENVSEKRMGGKLFLNGRGVDDGETPDWRNGAAVYIPVDDIQQLVAFSSLKDYKKNLDLRANRAEGKAASSRSRRGTRT